MSIQHDVIIVGGGGAGLRAAIAIAETNPKLSVALVSKVYPMRSHTVAAEGGSAAVIKNNDSLADHINDTIGGSDWLADQDAVELFVNEATREMTQMEHWGCPWSRDPDGKVAVRPFGGMKIERTWFAADKTGFHMLHTLYQTSLQFEPIKSYDEWFATKIIVENGRCQGVCAIEMHTGKLHTIAAKAVVLCTGGAGKVFPFTTNGAIKTGDGMALAYRAGVGLKDMEFIQYHPTGLPGTGILITEASRGEGGVMLNKDGRRYLQDYDLGTPLDVNDPRHPVKKSMELGPRDRLSQAFEKERQKGGTIKTPWGDAVNLDLRHLGEKKINKKLPFVRELAKNYAGVDPVHELIPVRPVVHYMMGGVDTDIHGATSLPGLFAAGEVACVSINGANRLGSNSLTELLVFGRRAGEAAANFASDHPDLSTAAIEAQGADERERVAKIVRKEKGSERIVTIRTEMQRTMEEGAGIYRSEGSLVETREKIAELRDRYKNILIEDRCPTFNTELTSVLELENMLDVAQAITASAIARKESRGAHQRTDYAERDDKHYLKHSVAHRTKDGGARVDYKEVTITKWPPKERVYGR